MDNLPDTSPRSNSGSASPIRSIGSISSRKSPPLRQKSFRRPIVVTKFETNILPLQQEEGVIAGKNIPFSEKIRRIFQKDIRTDSEAYLILKEIKNTAFFDKFLDMNDNLESKAMLEISKRIKYEKFPANSTIFRQGDASNGKLYIVYSGELNIHVQDPDIVFNQNMITQEEEVRKYAAAAGDSDIDSANVTSSNQFMRLDNSNDRTSPKVDFGQLERKSRLRKSTTSGQIPLNMTQTRGSRMNETNARSPTLRINDQDKNFLLSVNDSQSAGFTSAFNRYSYVSKMMGSPYKKEDFVANYGVIVDSVVKGGFFGDRALITNLPRAATLVTTTNCELLVITKDLFMSLKSRFDKKKNSTLDFIKKSIPTLDDIASKSFIERLLYLLKESHYEYGTTIISENSPGDHIYFIYEGECEVIKHLKVDQSLTFKRDVSEISPLLRLGKASSEAFLLCTITKGSLFGGEVLFEKLNSYKYTIRAVSPRVTVFSIQRSKFYMRFPRSAFFFLKKLYIKKTEAHEERLGHFVSNRTKNSQEGNLQLHIPPLRTEAINELNEQEESDQQNLIKSLRAKSHEAVQPFLVAKKAGPYYNVFKNTRPLTSRLTTGEQVLPPVLGVSPRDLSIDSQARQTLESFKVNEKTSGLSDRGIGLSQLIMMDGLKSPKAPKSARTLISTSRKDTRRTGEIDNLATERLGLEAQETTTIEDSLETGKVMLRSVVSREARTKDGACVTWEDYFEKIHALHPNLKFDLKKEEFEDLTSDINNFRVDVGALDPELEKKFKIMRIKKNAEESPKPLVPQAKNSRVLRIKASLIKRKKKFERKGEKLENKFSNLIQMRSTSNERMASFLPNNSSSPLIVTHRSTKNEMKDSFNRGPNEYGFDLSSMMSTERERSKDESKLVSRTKGKPGLIKTKFIVSGSTISSWNSYNGKFNEKSKDNSSGSMLQTSTQDTRETQRQTLLNADKFIKNPKENVRSVDKLLQKVVKISDAKVESYRLKR